jgi:phosphoglycolate phosphatase-like HAD superfamily hydrolase
MSLLRRRWIPLIACLLAGLLAGPFASSAAAAADPLPSWRGGAGKQRIINFVTNVATPGNPGYVTPNERIAVFDDDGTLWPEKPRAQGAFALRRLRDAAPEHPDWQTRLPYKAALDLGTKYLQEASDEDVFKLVAAAYAGRTQDAVAEDAEAFFASAEHPALNRPYAELAYAPMRELLAYLKANGFRVFVVSAGSVDVARVLSGQLLGIPPDDVIGSTVVASLREEDGRLVLRRLATAHAVNDGANKPVGIQMHIGQRPILAVGNVYAGGDIDMLRYSETGPGEARPSLQILIKHDDFQREFAYDEPDRASLNAADARGWMTVSMRYDWRRIFAHQELLEAPAPESGTDAAPEPIAAQ